MITDNTPENLEKNSDLYKERHHNICSEVEDKIVDFIKNENITDGMLASVLCNILGNLLFFINYRNQNSKELELINFTVDAIKKSYLACKETVDKDPELLNQILNQSTEQKNV